jgi:hypothetical protein
MKRQPFALPYAGIHQEADLSANHAAAAPVEPAVGDYIADALGGLGIPREQALKLGSAFGLFPEGFRESGRALAMPFVEPTAGNMVGAGVEAALMGLPAAKGVKTAAKTLGKTDEVRHLAGSLEPNPQQAHRMADDLQDHTPRSSHLPEQGGHSSIADDPLPGSFGVSPEEIAELRAAYKNDDAVPSGWYVHGRGGSKELGEHYPIQMTHDYETMRQYGGANYRDVPTGSGWAIAPTEAGRVLDFESADTPDIRSAAAAILRDARAGGNPVIADVVKSYWDDKPSPREISEAVRSNFAPSNIVNSAEAFDNMEWVEALLRTADYPDLVKTPDGAVAFNNGNGGLKAVRLFGGLPFALWAAGAGQNEPEVY